jgi:hypothetical protein
MIFIGRIVNPLSDEIGCCDHACAVEQVLSNEEISSRCACHGRFHDRLSMFALGHINRLCTIGCSDDACWIGSRKDYCAVPDRAWPNDMLGLRISPVLKARVMSQSLVDLTRCDRARRERGETGNYRA